MGRFIEGEDRQQVSLMPECLDDYIEEVNPVRVIDAFVGELDLVELGFEGAMPATTGRPAYHPATLLKVYIYGHLNRIQSSRRLERECQRNVELMWFTGRLAPDFKTIADFRLPPDPMRPWAEARAVVCRPPFQGPRQTSAALNGACRHSTVSTAGSCPSLSRELAIWLRFGAGVIQGS
jgi:hypothetical protein